MLIEEVEGCADVAAPPANIGHALPSQRPARLVDTTMLYAPASGGVKRYLSAKRRWLVRHRPLVKHSLVLPGARNRDGQELSLIQAAALPFGRGYRWPMSARAWTDRLIRCAPSLIEAEDPYVPGLAALRAGQALGVPVVGFCHSDVAALAPGRNDGWAAKTARRLWARRCARFDAVLAPSEYLADILRDAGVHKAQAMPLGVDVDVFNPAAADRARLCKTLGVPESDRLLVFAGRPALEKRIDVLIEAVERLGEGYRLVLSGAGAGAGVPRSDRVISLPFQQDSAKLARLFASCDALVHANPYESLGLVVLEAMACGLPVVGVAAGGVGETVDETFGQLADRPTSQAMAEAIEALFRRDVHALGQQARRRAVERYAWDAVFERLTGLYHDLTRNVAFVTPRP